VEDKEDTRAICSHQPVGVFLSVFLIFDSNRVNTDTADLIVPISHITTVFMMVNATTTSSRIRPINASSRTGSIRCGSAPPIRPLPLPSVTATTTQTPKSISRQVHLPPTTKTSSNPKSMASSVKKRKVPLRKIKSTQCREDHSDCRSNKNTQMISNCSVAMSRTESIMVSSAGDVIVCRCRRSSTPFLPPKARDPLNVWDKQFPCCDTDLLSSIDGPWSPTVFKSVNAKKKGRARTGSVSQVSTTTESSTYEWEKNDNKTATNVLGVKGSRGGSMGTNQDQKPSDLVRNQKSENRSNEKDDNYSLVEKEDQTTKKTGIEKREEEIPDRSLNQDDIIGDDLILSLPSFDYSHIIDGHNDMIPQIEQKNEGSEKSLLSTYEKKARQQRKGETPNTSSTILESRTEKRTKQHTRSRYDSRPLLDNEQKFFHGVPLFLSTLSQIRITKVSANPLGAHVLMISQEALLFTYGLNHCGQLGIGFQSEIKNYKRGFHTTPTLITPLLENGGKAINCAAGVDHSLVVISTGGRRLQKLQFDPGVAPSEYCVESLRASNSPCQTSFPSKNENTVDNERAGSERLHLSEKSVRYHQVYAFGRNNFMKLGLVRPHFNEGHAEGESTEDVVLPRRVGLHCTVWPNEELFDDDSLPSQGVFDIAASTEHSSALVRRASGDVEVYMWGNASLGALGLPLNIKSNDVRGEIARKPSSKEKNISPLPTILESLCHRRSRDPLSPFATKVSLGPYCSFVVMSNGKCMSCGFSAEGMLGHGFNTTFSMEPCEVFLPPSENDCELTNRIVSVSAGAFHALALSDDGNVYSWGINSNERLGLGAFDYSSIAPNIKDTKENLVVIEWVPQKIDIDKKYGSYQAKSSTNENNETTENKNHDRNRVSLACAGYDSSFLVTESGKVLSFGKRSGRLGKGEISSNVNTPQPLYGGLHLFRQRDKDGYAGTLRTKTPTRIRHRSISATALE
jgi:alpha-tubulin suppressor-like RCC1 family protein